MALNWNRWIRREWHRVAITAGAAAENPAVFSSLPSALREPPYGDIVACFSHYVAAARAMNQSAGLLAPTIDIALNETDSAAYNMARCVWLANELASSSATLSGWRLNSARRRAFDRFSFTLVPLGRSVGLAVRTSRALHGDAAWNIVRCKWLEAQVGHLVLAGAAETVRTPAQAAVEGTVGPATVLDWTTLTYGVEIECIRPTEISMAEFARRLTEAGIPTNAEFYNHHRRNYWKIVTDGSISDRHGIGMEVVSPILRGTADFDQIKKVSEILIGENRARPVCRINKTCGLHIHVGLPRREHQLPINVLRIYHHYEAVFDSLMPMSRRSNSYARPTAFTDRIARAATLDALRSSYGYDRYRKVNLESIWRHGTLEFRQHAGTIEAEKIIHWATLVLKLMAVANSAPTLASGPGTLSGLLGLVEATDEAGAFWTRRQASLAAPGEALAA
jgi:hypothetical protein